MKNFYNDEFNNQEEINSYSKILDILFFIGMLTIIAGIAIVLVDSSESITRMIRFFSHRSNWDIFNMEIEICNKKF